jgi:hypothetical protein
MGWQKWTNNLISKESKCCTTRFFLVGIREKHCLHRKNPRFASSPSDNLNCFSKSHSGHASPYLGRSRIPFGCLQGCKRFTSRFVKDVRKLISVSILKKVLYFMFRELLGLGTTEFFLWLCILLPNLSNCFHGSRKIAKALFTHKEQWLPGKPLVFLKSKRDDWSILKVTCCLWKWKFMRSILRDELSYCLLRWGPLTTENITKPCVDYIILYVFGDW